MEALVADLPPPLLQEPGAPAPAQGQVHQDRDPGTVSILLLILFKMSLTTLSNSVPVTDQSNTTKEGINNIYFPAKIFRMKSINSTLCDDICHFY